MTELNQELIEQIARELGGDPTEFSPDKKLEILRGMIDHSPTIKAALELYSRIPDEKTQVCTDIDTHEPYCPFCVWDDITEKFYCCLSDQVTKQSGNLTLKNLDCPRPFKNQEAIK